MQRGVVEAIRRVGAWTGGGKAGEGAFLEGGEGVSVGEGGLYVGVWVFERGDGVAGVEGDL